MRLTIIKLTVLFGLLLAGCSASDIENKTEPSVPDTPSQLEPGSLGLVGDTTDVTSNTILGLVLMGGSTDVDAAFKWMIDRCQGGDVVVIRTSGTNAYNDYIYKLGKVNSVETLLINSRTLANNPAVVQKIREAEMLFIAGGDQSTYRQNWRGTKTMDALNYLLNEKKIPFGGTSAGCAILGGMYFSGEKGTITSAAALANPYDEKITLYTNDFLKAPYLKHVITDQHFSQRDRQGRLVTFLARLMKDSNFNPYAIGVDEQTAVCIDENGMATVLGNNSGYFLKTDQSTPPEVLKENEKLTWNQNQQAIVTFKILATSSENAELNVKAFDEPDAKEVQGYWWWVNTGKLKFNAK